MTHPIWQFHLAIAVADLEAGRQFYVNVLGASEGRATSNHVDLDFFGHHLVLHQAPPGPAAPSFESDFHGESVPVPHFGINCSRAEFAALATRIKQHAYPFADPPHVRTPGEPGEHASMFLLDPSGNALEFKAFKNHAEVFSRLFAEAGTADDAFDVMVEHAAGADSAVSPLQRGESHR
jgi:extradiol dioxygenase family protein